MTDEQLLPLLLGAKTGDRRAFDELWPHCSGPLLRQAEQRLEANPQLRRRVGASEITNDTATAVWNALRDGRFRGTTLPEFRAFARVVLANEFLRQLRRHQGDRGLGRELHAVGDDDPLAAVPDTESSPSAVATSAERLDALRVALDGLDSPRQREVLALRYFEGLSFREIAKRLGIEEMNLSTVSGLHDRGLKKLRAALGDDFDPEPPRAN